MRKCWFRKISRSSTKKDKSRNCSLATSTIIHIKSISSIRRKNCSAKPSTFKEKLALSIRNIIHSKRTLPRPVISPNSLMQRYKKPVRPSKDSRKFKDKPNKKPTSRDTKRRKHKI